MASSESHNTRPSGMKQDLVDFANDLSLSCLKIALTKNSTLLIVNWI